MQCRLISNLAIKFHGGENEKTLYDSTFGSDFMLYGRLPGEEGGGRA